MGQKSLMEIRVWSLLSLLSVCVFDSPGGHDNFRKMIDEAEPLGYPVVVKNARGHRGECRTCLAAFVFLFFSSEDRLRI